MLQIYCISLTMKIEHFKVLVASLNATICPLFCAIQMFVFENEKKKKMRWCAGQLLRDQKNTVIYGSKMIRAKTKLQIIFSRQNMKIEFAYCFTLHFGCHSGDCRMSRAQRCCCNIAQTFKLSYTARYVCLYYCAAVHIHFHICE